MKSVGLPWRKVEDEQQLGIGGVQHEAYTTFQGFDKFYLYLDVLTEVGSGVYTWSAGINLCDKQMLLARCEPGNEFDSLSNAKAAAENWYFNNAMLLVQYILPVGIDMGMQKRQHELKHEQPDHAH